MTKWHGGHGNISLSAGLGELGGTISLIEANNYHRSTIETGLADVDDICKLVFNLG